MLRTLIVFLLQFSVVSAHNNSYGNNTQNCELPNKFSRWVSIDTTGVNLTDFQVYFFDEFLNEVSNDDCGSPIFIDLQSHGNEPISRRETTSTNLFEAGYNMLYFVNSTGHQIFRARFCCSGISLMGSWTADIKNPSSNFSLTNSNEHHGKRLLSSDGVVCGERKVKPLKFSVARFSPEMKVEPNSWPWIIAIRKDLHNKNAPNKFCTGSLISRKFVLTAAHCVDKENAKNLRIIAGYHGNTHSGHHGNKRIQESAVESIHVHEKYNPETFTNDIALVRLKTPFIYSIYVQPICLPTLNASNFDYTFVVGWDSKIEEKSNITYLKQEAGQMTSGIDNPWSIDYKPDEIYLYDPHQTGNYSYDDTGAQTYYSEHNQYFVTGIAMANGRYQHSTDIPPGSVFVNVFFYVPWLKSVIEQNR